MSFTRDTNTIPLFGSKGDFHGQIKLSASRNIADNTFTVKVEGVRAYCKYGWDFATHVEVRLATDSSGRGAVSDTGKISSSGSISYTGWLPKSGYSDTAKCSKTFKANADGTCPAVYLYARFYNDSVYWINEGIDVTVSTTYHENISSTVQSQAGGQIDRSGPTISISKGTEKVTSISFSGSSNVNCDQWQYQLDEGTWTLCDQSTSKGSSQTLRVTEGSHKVRLRARRTSNNVYGYSECVNYSTTRPTISNFTMTPTSSTTATVNFKCNKDCNWYLEGPDGTKLTSWSAAVSANTQVSKSVTVSSTSGTYTLHVRRTSNNSLTGTATTTCDTVLPTINTFTITPVNGTTANIKFKCDKSFDYCIRKPGGATTSWSGTYAANTEHSVNLPVSSVHGYYTLYVRRTSANGLTANKAAICDTRLPVIESFTLVPISATQADAYIKVSLASTWSIDTSSVNDPTGSTNYTYSGYTYSGIVTLDENRDKSYTLTVARTSCSGLTATKTVVCNTTRPTINIKHVLTHANTVTFTAESNVPCKNWKYIIRYKTNSADKTEVFNSGRALSKTFTITDIRMNEEFELYVEATKISNGALGTTKYARTITCLGVGHIVKDNQNKEKLVTAYVYTQDKGWVSAVPYICTSIENGKPQWDYGR